MDHGVGSVLDCHIKFGVSVAGACRNPRSGAHCPSRRHRMSTTINRRDSFTIASRRFEAERPEAAMSATAECVVIDAFPLSNQMEAWRAALASFSLDCRLADGVSLHSGELAIKSSSTGARVAMLRSTAQEIVSAGRPVSGKTHPHILIIYHVSGRGRTRAQRGACEFADGDISICDLEVAWSMELRDDFEMFILEVPRERLFGRLGRNRIELPTVLGATIAAAAARPVMRTLAGNLSALEQADLATGEIAVTELVAGALLGETKSVAETVTQVQAAHLRRVYAAIEARLGDPNLSMADIASQESLSQRYLQRLFERQETTFSNYVRERRLERCCVDLVDAKHADQAIADIGYRWGFRDQASFSRAFSAAYGVSPRSFRKAAPRSSEIHATRGRPLLRTVASHPLARSPVDGEPDGPEPDLPSKPAPVLIERSGDRDIVPARYHLAVSKDTVHWGYLSRSISPVLRVGPDAHVTIETLTQHGCDDHERMIKGDAGAESVYHWTTDAKNVDRRGAGPMNASIFGRGAGEGFGVHICTGPVYVRGAEPGDVLEVQIRDIRPRPCANARFAGKAFGSNAAAWWGFQYHDLIETPHKREVVTIYETDAAAGADWARAVYNYRWTPQTDPFGVRHETMDYPGVPVNHDLVEEVHGIMKNVRIPTRPHFGFICVAPRESEVVDSIPPGYFGGNIDNWRAGKGTTLYLPVAVPGALFSVGDPHLAQGDGEINGTALEFSLTGEFRLVVHKAGQSAKTLSCRPVLSAIGDAGRMDPARLQLFQLFARIGTPCPVGNL
jgi:acetamidase/formamidase/AraC-like DNA-binding protein